MIRTKNHLANRVLTLHLSEAETLGITLKGLLEVAAKNPIEAGWTCGSEHTLEESKVIVSVLTREQKHQLANFFFSEPDKNVVKEVKEIDKGEA